MDHKVIAMDGYESLWRCKACGEYFESESGFAICPNSVVKGFVKKYSGKWFYHIKVDGNVLFRGEHPDWGEVIRRVVRLVTSLRPTPQNWTIGKVRNS